MSKEGPGDLHFQPVPGVLETPGALTTSTKPGGMAGTV